MVGSPSTVRSQLRGWGAAARLFTVKSQSPSFRAKLCSLDCEIAILAGGLSTRMGRDKARLRLGGRTLLAHVKAVARQTGLPFRVIRRDLVPRCGPLGGVYTALKCASAGAVMVLSCDMPFVLVELLARLRGRLRTPAAAVFCVTTEGAGFPFLIRRTALPVVEKQLAMRRFSLQALATKLEAGKLRPAPARAAGLFNVNTPEDWEAARSRWRARRRKSVGL